MGCHCKKKSKCTSIQFCYFVFLDLLDWTYGSPILGLIQINVSEEWFWAMATLTGVIVKFKSWIFRIFCILWEWLVTFKNDPVTFKNDPVTFKNDPVTFKNYQLLLRMSRLLFKLALIHLLSHYYERHQKSM